jgi:hypothetical protein
VGDVRASHSEAATAKIAGGSADLRAEFSLQEIKQTD